MTTQQRLLAALAAAHPGASQAALARIAGLSQQRFNNYATGNRRMDDDAVIGCATALGWDVREAVATHRADLAGTERARRFWKRVSAAAAVAGIAIMFAPLGDQKHALFALFSAIPLPAEPLTAVYIMRTALVAAAMIALAVWSRRGRTTAPMLA